MGKKIIIAGGGTGGHIFPAIAIANALKWNDPSIEILFVGAKDKMEMEKVPQAGYRIIGITIAGLNRSSVLKNISLPFKLISSFFEVRKIFKSFQPNAVVGVGGYASFPVLRYAQSKKIPSFIHESNSFAGKSNILLGKKATKIFVAVEGMEKFFPSNKILISGNPVRKEIAEARVNKTEALSYFGLNPDKITILAMGGSLGARSINRAIANQINDLEKNGLQLIWQTGKSTADDFKKVAEGRSNIWINEFISEMEMAYAAADLVISRAGAMAVTEIAITAKPAVFVPYPNAADDHQTHNALSLVNNQAALLVKDSEAGSTLMNEVIALAKDEAKRNRFSANCSRLVKKEADQIIANEILSSIK